MVQLSMPANKQIECEDVCILVTFYKSIVRMAYVMVPHLTSHICCELNISAILSEKQHISLSHNRSPPWLYKYPIAYPIDKFALIILSKCAMKNTLRADKCTS